MNCEGKTIKSPTDGFCKIPESNPPHFLMVGSTTTTYSSLKSKWLKESDENKYKGDLFKAYENAQELKKEFHDAEFTVILASNRIIKEELITLVYTKAKKYGLEVNIFEQSRLTHILDTFPEGQYIRKSKLGIACEQLSDKLLRDICEDNLKKYKNRINVTDFDNLITRDINRNIKTSINQYDVNFLVGESGLGKSVISYQLLEEHINNGYFGLWISEDIISDCFSVENVIEKVVRSISPDLPQGIGKDVINIGHNKEKFLIIIDDINRADNPYEIIKKINSWVHNKKEENIIPFTLICPIWSEISLDDLKNKILINTILCN